MSNSRIGIVAATSSLVAAILASACCLVPLSLVTLGVTGAWIGSFSALDPYKNYFLVVSLLLFGAGFWQVYRNEKKACAEGSKCDSSNSQQLVKIALWVSVGLVVLSFSVNWWAPLFY